MRVELPYAVFGLIVIGGKVVVAPPIAKWTVGKWASEVKSYYRGRGGKVKTS